MKLPITLYFKQIYSYLCFLFTYLIFIFTLKTRTVCFFYPLSFTKCTKIPYIDFIKTYTDEAIMEEKAEGGRSRNKSLLELLADGIADNSFHVRT